MNKFYSESTRYFNDILDNINVSGALKDVLYNLVKYPTKYEKLDAVGELMTSTIGLIDSKKNKTYDLKPREHKQVLGWLYTCNIVGMCNRYDDFKKLIPSSGGKFFIKDLGVLNYIASKLILHESDLNGVRAKNFVYIYLMSKTSKYSNIDILFKEDTPYFATHDKNKYEIDFLMHSIGGLTVAIEVKNKKGDTESSKIALKNNCVDMIIKLQNTFGGINEKRITLPIFAIDKIGELV